MPWRWFNKHTRAYWGLTVPLGLAVFSLYVSLDYFWYAQRWGSTYKPFYLSSETVLHIK
jgi:hypothetical protein